MRKYINEIANVITGYSFRKAINGYSSGISVFQAKNIESNLLFNNSFILPKTDLKPEKVQSYLIDGDIVISSRGNFKASVFRSKERAIASSSIYIIRVFDDKILPEYLAMFLNSNEGQNQLNRLSRGGLIKTLLKKDLEIIKFPIPPLENQREIVNFYLDIKKEKDLYNRKSEIYTQIIDSTFNKN